MTRIAIILLLNASVALAQKPSMADSAQNLNRTGKWSQAFDLASRHLTDSGATRSEVCGLHISRTYAALRLVRKADAVTAFAAAKIPCSNVDGVVDQQLKEIQSELMQMPDPAPLDSIDAVVISPIHTQPFFCSEHRQNDMPLGDRFGTDCLIANRDQLPDGSFSPMTFFRASGTLNEEWYGWNMPVLAPFDGRVESVTVNREDNRVGRLGAGIATAITFVRADSVKVVYAHLGTVVVAQGDSVRAGQTVGTVGNNGKSYSPHTHVGAWKGLVPLQVRFDLRK